MSEDSKQAAEESLLTLLKDNSPARTILGNDYISPQKITEARGISYSAEQLQWLASTLPNEKQLCWMKKNNYALVVGPPTEMNLLDVRSVKPSLFYSDTEDWYAKNQPFAVNEKVGCRWLGIRKAKVLRSLNKNWDAQLELLSKDREVPSTVQMSWFITTYYEVCGIHLFKDVYVRTSSVTSRGSRVNVGGFDEFGLDIERSWGNEFNKGLGLAVSLKLKS